MLDVTNNKSAYENWSFKLFFNELKKLCKCSNDYVLTIFVTAIKFFYCFGQFTLPRPPCDSLWRFAHNGLWNKIKNGSRIDQLTLLSPICLYIFVLYGLAHQSVENSFVTRILWYHQCFIYKMNTVVYETLEEIEESLSNRLDKDCSSICTTGSSSSCIQTKLKPFRHQIFRSKFPPIGKIKAP